MPLYKVNLVIQRFDEVLLEANNQEEAKHLAFFYYDTPTTDPRIQYTECEEEHIMDGTEVLCLDDDGTEIPCPDEDDLTEEDA